MDRTGIPDAPRRNRQPKQRKGKAKGLKLVDRNGYIHITGTIRIAGKSVRIRKTTELSADVKENWDTATAIRIAKEEEIKNEVVYGISPKQSWSAASLKYLERRQQKRKAMRLRDAVIKNDPEYVYIMAFTDFLEARGLHMAQISEIDSDVANAFIAEHHINHGHSVSTMKRTWNPIRAVFNGAKVAPPKLDLPDQIDTSKIPVIGKWLYPEEIALFLECCHPSFRPLAVTLWNTGRRVGELIWLSRRFPNYESSHATGINLADGREHIYLGRTKNGQPKIVYLDDTTATVIRGWLATRADDHDELFLTYKGHPYSPRKQNEGGQIDTAFKAARRRAADIMERPVIESGWGNKERAAVMRRVTPHWARHNLTSHLLANGQSNEAVQRDLGWSSKEMVNRYGHDLPGLGKARANLVQFGSDTKLTLDNMRKAKNK